jgi:hypothetical protein
MKKLLLVAPLALVALLAGGCPDQVATNTPRPDCLIDADCSAGTLCMEGFCTPRATGSCEGNADCDGNQVCRGPVGDRRCVEPVEGGECAGDDDCARTERCTTSLPDGEADCLVSVECAASEPDAGCDEACYGHCVARPSCADDVDCAVTESCEGGLCLPIGDCDSDSDCPITAACVAGTCTDNGDCSTDEDCATDQSCVAGDCSRNDDCSVDADCPADQRCTDGTCTRRAPCLTDDACGFDERCDLDNDGGTCVVIGECDTVDDCPAEDGIACLDGTCTRAPCGRDSECDDGLFCNGQETCNPRVGCASGTPPTTTGLPACANESCDEENDRLVLTPVHSRCADASPCTDDVCDVGLGCSNPVNTFQPAPGPIDDCVRTVCLDGAVAVVNDNSELPSVQGPTNDCLQAICRDGASVFVANDAETPPQTSATDCRREICQNGASTSVANDNETPPQGVNNDCRREVCSGGVSTQIPDNSEIPPQGPATDCRREVCAGGVSTQVANDTEIPTQGPTNDCKREICSNGAITQVANDAETPPQGSATDCQREVCSGGVSTQVADNSQLPPAVGCRDGACVAGAPTTIADDDNCNDTAVCTVGSCNADGSCTQTPDDDLCDCSGTQVGLCRPADPRASTSGALAGCVCLQPATLSCGLDDGDDVKRVLERFELFAEAPGAAAGSTFTWDIAGTPVGADPSAQVIGNATSPTAAFFQATSPSAPGVRDWQLRVTLQEPELPPQTCTVSVEAQPIPDALEVSLFMDDAVDVDVHVVGGPGSTRFDMPFHELHDPLFDDEDNDCYWNNCPVCTVSIPGVPCVAVSPRRVDFDGDGASLADLQDPQLDIDNTRGCFIADNGERSCVPEKITVEQPAAGTYFVWTYLWGTPNSLNPSLTSPSSIPVTVDIQCRGQRVTRTRTLKSDTTDGSGVAAVQNSARRYGGVLGFIQIDVPASGACTISN